jgi:hypothetical protein
MESVRNAPESIIPVSSFAICEKNIHRKERKEKDSS